MAVTGLEASGLFCAFADVLSRIATIANTTANRMTSIRRCSRVL